MSTTAARSDTRHLLDDRPVDDWYGDVMSAWDSLLEPGTGEHWRNLGYWTDATRTLEEASRLLARRLADAADVGPHDDVLDVGCGLGESTRMLARRRHAGPDGPRIVGLDYTAAHVRGARACTPGPDGPEFLQGSAVDLPFPDASFDRVLALECSFHFPGRDRFMAEARRVLRPGGTLGLAEVLIGRRPAGLRRAMLRLLPAAAHGRMDGFVSDGLKNPTENLVDIHVLADQMRRAGFAVTAQEDISRNVFPGFRRHWFRHADRRRQEEVLRAGGLDAVRARETAAAWRRQMHRFILMWPMSDYYVLAGRAT